MSRMRSGPPNDYPSAGTPTGIVVLLGRKEAVPQPASLYGADKGRPRDEHPSKSKNPSQADLRRLGASRQRPG